MVRHHTRAVVAVTAMMAAWGAQAKEGAHIAFVGCPIVQDTPTVPCWLTEYGGTTYYMGIQSDVSAPFNPPSLGHKVLVEGTVSDREACGAKVIEPIVISIMPELSPGCGELRMARHDIDLGFEPPRPPGPSAGRLAFAPPPAPPPPEPPYAPQSWTISYAFEGMVNFQTPAMIEPALQYAQLVKAKEIKVSAFRGATRLSDGSLLVEHQGIARERAEEIANMLRGAGLAKTPFKVSFEENITEEGPPGRKVVITVVP